MNLAWQKAGAEPSACPAAQVLEARRQAYGELAPECITALLEYGRALLELVRSSEREVVINKVKKAVDKLETAKDAPAGVMCRVRR